ncbi:MAG: hypothetical protein NVSMB52_06170 [Chloroflexota bacterium]
MSWGAWHGDTNDVNLLFAYYFWQTLERAQYRDVAQDFTVFTEIIVQKTNGLLIGVHTVKYLCGCKETALTGTDEK